MSATGDFLHRYFNLGFYDAPGKTSPRAHDRVDPWMIEPGAGPPKHEFARPNAGWDWDPPPTAWGSGAFRRRAASASPAKRRVLIWVVAFAALFLLGASIALLRSPSVIRPVVHALPVIALVLGVLVAIWALATAVQWLRVLENRLYWELACYAMLCIGIVVRQAVGLGNTSVLSLGGVGASLAIGFAVFPYGMRRMNKFRPQPGIAHVAFPFGLGFFLDLGRIAAVHWVPTL